MQRAIYLIGCKSNLITARDQGLQHPHPLTDSLPPHLEEMAEQMSNHAKSTKSTQVNNKMAVKILRQWCTVPSLQGCGCLWLALS
jgi:hypothetical protein